MKPARVNGLHVRHQETLLSELLETLKTELECFGKANDATTGERPRRMLNITRDTGQIDTFPAVSQEATWGWWNNPADRGIQGERT